MNDMATLNIGVYRIRATDGRMFIRVLGENGESDVTEALQQLDEFRISLGVQDISHQTMKRKDGSGGYVVDCISFNTGR